MIRATTPTHRFTFPFDVIDTCKEVLITYVQRDKIVLEKRLKDLIAKGNTVYFILTQEETNKFTPENVQIQVRVLTYEEEAMASPIYNLTVQKILNDEVLS